MIIDDDHDDGDKNNDDDDDGNDDITVSLLLVNVEQTFANQRQITILLQHISLPFNTAAQYRYICAQINKKI